MRGVLSHPSTSFIEKYPNLSRDIGKLNLKIMLREEAVEFEFSNVRSPETGTLHMRQWLDCKDDHSRWRSKRMQRFWMVLMCSSLYCLIFGLHIHHSEMFPCAIQPRTPPTSTNWKVLFQMSELLSLASMFVIRNASTSYNSIDFLNAPNTDFEQMSERILVNSGSSINDGSSSILTFDIAWQNEQMIVKNEWSCPKW